MEMRTHLNARQTRDQTLKHPPTHPQNWEGKSTGKVRAMTNPNEKQSATSDIWETKQQQQQQKLKKKEQQKNMSVLFQISFPYGFSEAVYEVRKERKTKRRLTGKHFV